MSNFENMVPQAKKLAQTPEGQQLAALMQQIGGPSLQQAMEQAATGDFSQAQRALSSLLQNPQARQLLQQLGEKYGK